MRTLSYFVAVSVSAFVVLFGAQAQAEKITLDVPYAEPAAERQMLDIYAPDDAKNAPVVFWIHGGGWQAGNKGQVKLKPKAFVDKGYVFVSTNYRLYPNVDMETIHADVAKAIRWTHDNIAKHGGDPKRIVVGGHSAGAELAGLICTDESYMKAEGLSLAIFKACFPVDGDTYDIPKQIDVARERRKPTEKAEPKFGHYMKFGNDPAKHRNFSAVNHVARDQGIPPFFLLYVADHADTSAQAQALGKVLIAAGIPTELFGAKETTHVKVNDDIGLADDPATKALFAFLDKALAK